MKPNQLIVPNADFTESLLFDKLTPGLDGLIIGEEPGRGDLRRMQPGRCVNFDGTDDYINCGLNLLTTDDFTLSFWVYPTTSGANRGIFGMGNAYAVAGTGINTYINSGTQLTTYINSGGAGNPYTYFATLLHAVWSHVVIVINRAASQAQTWVNGVGGSVSSIATVTGSIASGDLTLGRYAGGYLFPGRMSDFQIIPRVVTGNEVQQLYRHGASALPGQPRTAWYKLDDQHPVVTFDSSGNNRHAVLTNVNATLGNFFYEGADVPHSYQNDKGFTVADNLYSQAEFTDAYWTKTGSVAEVGGLVYPTTTADFVRVSTSPMSGVNGERFTMSVEAKAAGVNYIGLASAGGSNYGARFNIQTGEVESITSTTNVKAWVEPLAGGWYRVSVSDTVYIGNIYNSITLASTSTGYQTVKDGTSGVRLRNPQLTINPTPVPYYSAKGYAFNKIRVPRNESNKPKDIFGYDLMHSGGCPRNAQLTASNCLTLDGTNDFVAIPNHASLVYTGSKLTLAGWFRSTTAGSGLIQRFVSTSAGWRLVRSSNYTYFSVVTSVGGFTQVTNSLNYTDSKWHHFAGVYDGATILLYVDGVQVASAAKTGNLVDGGDTTKLGHDTSLGYHNGSMADVRVYYESLSASEILHLATAGKQGTVPVQTPALHYPMGEGGGERVYDVGPNAVHGTITNADLVTAWATKQDIVHYNAARGFSAVENWVTTSEPDSGASTMPAVAADMEFALKLGVTGMLDCPATTTTLYYSWSQPQDARRCYASVVVKMDDGSKPVCATTSSGGDFMFVMWQGFTGGGITYDDLGDGFWRVTQYCASRNAVGASAIYRYSTHSGKGFRASQLHTYFESGRGYVKTIGSSAPPLNLPAKTASLTVQDSVVSSPAGPYHNLSESKIDLTQGVASPGSAALLTAWDPLPVDMYTETRIANPPWATYRVTLADELSVLSPITGQPVRSVTATNEYGTHATDYAFGGATNATKYTFSLVCKPKGMRYILFLSATPAVSQYFDLQDKAVLGTFNTVADDAWIEDLGGGWVRCCIVATSTSGSLKAGLYLANTSSSISFTGNNVDGIYADTLRVTKYNGRTNPLYLREVSQGGRVVSVDRILQYRSTLAGMRNIIASKFVTPKVIS